MRNIAPLILIIFFALLILFFLLPKILFVLGVFGLAYAVYLYIKQLKK